MENKHKFFALGFVLGFASPFFEHLIKYRDPSITSFFAKALVVGGDVWQYVFLYLIVAITIILYFPKIREKINPESRYVFLVSGVALGFAIISIISATINFIK